VQAFARNSDYNMYLEKFFHFIRFFGKLYKKVRSGVRMQYIIYFNILTFVEKNEKIYNKVKESVTWDTSLVSPN